jgi:hypothetical protein
MTVLKDVAPCSLIKFADVSDLLAMSKPHTAYSLS